MINKTSKNLEIILGFVRRRSKTERKSCILFDANGRIRSEDAIDTAMERRQLLSIIAAVAICIKERRQVGSIESRLAPIKSFARLKIEEKKKNSPRLEKTGGGKDAYMYKFFFKWKTSRKRG